MRAALRFVSVEDAVPFAVAATVVAFACGSSSVAYVDRIGKDVRWAILLLLFACVALLFLVRVAWSRSRPFVLAAWLLALAVASTAWSVDRVLTIERAASLGILFATAFLLATSAASLALIERVLVAILVGAVIVALLGFIVLAFDRDGALQPASAGVPTRFRGFGEDSNTAALLFAVVLPVAAWGVARGGRRSRRIAAASAFLLLDGSIVGALSRGALTGAFIGVLVVALAAPRNWRARAGYVATGLALAGLSFGITTTASPPPSASAAPVPAVAASTTGRDGSGRLAAWRGALDQAGKRPVAGYGFGTEDKVFVNHFRDFSGDYVQNYYLGLLLQLGAIGVASFVALMLVWLARARSAYIRLADRDRLSLVACAGMVLAGLACAVVQSYLTSVGNIATGAFWIGAFVLATLGDPWSVWPYRPPID